MYLQVNSPSSMHTSSPSSPASNWSPRSNLSHISSTLSLASTTSFATSVSDFVSSSSEPVSTPKTSKTDAFFSSDYSTSPTSSTFPPSPPAAAAHQLHRPPRSLNFDFFATPSLDDYPTPPPSVRSTTPNSILSRLFPSRHTTVDDSKNQVVEHRQLPTPVNSPPPPPKVEIIESPTATTSPSLPTSHTAGAVITDPDHPLSFTLLQQLGQGTFSTVWLASPSTALEKKRPRKTSSHTRRERLHPLDGTRPWMPLARAGSVGSSRSVYLNQTHGEAPSGAAPRDSDHDDASRVRLVALKLTPRQDDRTRVSFVREVEILRHISHPAIVSHLASFTTHDAHVLALENLSGGELFDLVNSDSAHSRLTERIVKRMWSDIAGAVSWMHGVGLVHRDIKLENILLTTAFGLPFPPEPHPLVKLTDFGLARFIDRSAPELTTRCGSEAYAAPELLIAGGRPYDGRETDAWACGVVLYALATQRMPFDGGRISRIVAGVYTWPEDEMTPEEEQAHKELVGTDIGRSTGLRRTVARLLVRNPKERARMIDVCGPEWPAEEGEGLGGGVKRVRDWFAGVPEVNVEGLPISDFDDDSGWGGDGHDEDECDFTDGFPSNACGHLVDRAGIPSIASEEVPWLS